MADDIKTKAPDLAGAFERARKEPEQEVKRAKLTLELRPPVPTPMGMGPPPAQVSPQLRRREELKRELSSAALVKRDFNRAARDSVER